MADESCVFCQIIAGRSPAEIVWESDEFIAIKNKFPKAPVHLLVMPKAHIEKKKLVGSNNEEFWGKILRSAFEVIRQEGLDKSGYKLVNNGAGYNHLEHEHLHILGGTSSEPGGET